MGKPGGVLIRRPNGTFEEHPERPAKDQPGTSGLWSSCRVLRMKRFRKGSISMITNQTVAGQEYTVVEECGIPLFQGPEKSSGACDSCKRGWTRDGLWFATEVEEV